MKRCAMFAAVAALLVPATAQAAGPAIGFDKPVFLEGSVAKPVCPNTVRVHVLPPSFETQMLTWLR